MASLLTWLFILAFEIVFAVNNPDPVTGGCVGFAFAALLYDGIPSYLRERPKRELRRIVKRHAKTGV